MYTPTLIAGCEAISEFLRQKLPAYWIIYKMRTTTIMTTKCCCGSEAEKKYQYAVN